MVKSSYLSLIGPSGTGKTMLTANLGLAFVRLGYDVLIVDNNPFPAMGYHFGIPLPERTIKKTIANKQSLKEALYKHPSGLKLLLNSPLENYLPFDYNLLEGMAQIILIDGQKFKNNVVCVNPNMPSVMNAVKNIIDFNTVGIIINHKDSTYLCAESLSVLANREVLFKIDFEKKQKEALKQGVPLFELEPEHQFSINLLQFASKLLGKEYEILVEHNG